MVRTVPSTTTLFAGTTVRTEAEVRDRVDEPEVRLGVRGGRDAAGVVPERIEANRGTDRRPPRLGCASLRSPPRSRCGWRGCSPSSRPAEAARAVDRDPVDDVLTTGVRGHRRAQPVSTEDLVPVPRVELGDERLVAHQAPARPVVLKPAEDDVGVPQRRVTGANPVEQVRGQPHVGLEPAAHLRRGHIPDVPGDEEAAVGAGQEHRLPAGLDDRERGVPVGVHVREEAQRGEAEPALRQPVGGARVRRAAVGGDDAAQVTAEDGPARVLRVHRDGEVVPALHVPDVDGGAPLSAGAAWSRERACWGSSRWSGSRRRPGRTRARSRWWTRCSRRRSISGTRRWR